MFLVILGYKSVWFVGKYWRGKRERGVMGIDGRFFFLIVWSLVSCFLEVYSFFRFGWYFLILKGEFFTSFVGGI